LREVEEYHRVDKFEKIKSRPLKVTFQSRQSVVELLRIAYKLKYHDEFKQVKKRRNKCKEDRELLKLKLDKVKLKKIERSEEEETCFFPK